MKKIFYFLLFLCCILVTAAGCKKFLDIVPDERSSEKDAFRDRVAAKGYLYSCYGYLPRSSETYGAIDLLTTDEVVTAFEHEVFAKFPRGQYTASDPVISYWNDLYKGIRQCYILIKNIDGVPDMADGEADLYKSEANFLIGYFHFLLARMYGPVIIADKEYNLNMPADQYPVRASYDECVDFIVKKMDESATGLPIRQATDADYGRATSIVAKCVKSRILLYAASPLFNGGGEGGSTLYADFKSLDGKQLISTTYNAEKWKKAAEAAREAIEAAETAGFQLYQNSSFSSELPSNPVEKDLRFTFVDRNSKEVIWAETRREGIYDLQNKSTPFVSGVAFNGVAPTLSILETFYTKNGLPIDKDPAYNYKDRYSVLEGTNGKTMALNLNREPRFNAWISYHNGYYEVSRGKERQILTQFRRNDNCGIQGRANNYSPTGYLNKKGVAPTLDQSRLQVSVNYPWPIFRLAELYLNYAESLIEYGQDLVTAKKYIDRVRERAGIPTIDRAWAAVGGAANKTILRKIVRQEKSIELYLENHRFWDARRWMEAEGAFNHNAKGLNIQGATDNDFFKITEVAFPRSFSQRNYLMPIVQSEINKNESLIQNPGY